jgi:S-adenosylmethionine decarboxylase
MTHANQSAEGTHVLLDLYGVKRLDDAAHLDTALRHAAKAAGAHIIGANFHHFGVGQGVTGVLLLAESHISIHSWPERNFAAVDLFLCGNINGVDAAIKAIISDLKPKSFTQQRILRGISDKD